MFARLTNRVARLALILLIVLACLYTAQVTVGVPIEALGAFLDRWASMVGRLLAVLVIAFYARSSGRSSTGWLLIAAGQACWAFGDAYFAIALWDADPMPFPSLADAGWVALYFPTLAGVVLLIRAHTAGHTEPISLLDAAIGALAISAAGAALAFGAIVDATGGSHLAIATNLAYPLGDLAVVAIMVAGLATAGWRFSRGWTVLMAGIALFAYSDTAYLFAIANDTYQRGIVDAGWLVSGAVIALAVRQPWAVTRVRVQTWSAFVFPAVFGAIGLAVLVYDHFRAVHVLALVLAALSVAAVIARMSLIFRQNISMIRRSTIDASTDALTGLGNRRRLLADLAAVQDGEATLVLLDLDGFKVYNDTYGHPAGDALLARLGDRLATSAGEGVAAYRLGGDEFCVLAHDADRAQEHAGTASAALA